MINPYSSSGPFANFEPLTQRFHDRSESHPVVAGPALALSSAQREQILAILEQGQAAGSTPSSLLVQIERVLAGGGAQTRLYAGTAERSEAIDPARIVDASA